MARRHRAAWWPHSARYGPMCGTPRGRELVVDPALVTCVRCLDGVGNFRRLLHPGERCCWCRDAMTAGLPLWPAPFRGSPRTVRPPRDLLLCVGCFEHVDQLSTGHPTTSQRGDTPT